MRRLAALDPTRRPRQLGAMFPIRDHNPSSRTPYVTYALLAANILVFALTWSLESQPRARAEFYFDWALIPALNSPVTFISSTFLHAGFMHLAGNMLFLWIFGDNMEDKMGHIGFLIFYLLGGVGAGLAQVMTDPGSNVPIVGASGAIAAVMGGYLLLFPRAKVDILLILIVFFKVFSIPAWVMLGLWFALQLFSGVTTDLTGGGVAYWAHAGGFVVGAILTIPIWLHEGGPSFWRRTDGHPDHPDAKYDFARSSIPKVRRK
jgi:membrane associated rhomboid family serine protease